MARRNGDHYPAKGTLIRVRAPERRRSSIEKHGVLWIVEGPGVLLGNIHAKSLATGATQFWRHNEYELARIDQPAGHAPGEGHADPDTVRNAEAGRKG